jgi:4-hydroxy-3-polyprenylbenzoate decarboxylase
LDIAFTDTGMQVFMDETGGNVEVFRTFSNVKILDNHGYYNRNASGSNAADVMIVVPCTMGTVGRIANGTTSDLISRIAEVQLKERRRLVIVPRETPYSLIHLRNLQTLTEAGAIIAPASPSFYSNPSSLDDLTDQFADRIIAIAGISDINPSYKWMNVWH